MKIFLTGGTGLLGRYFAELAVSQGAQLVALLRPTSQTRHLQSLGATLHISDLADGQNLAAGMQGCEVVVHLASLKGGWRRPELFERHIVQGK